MRIAIIGSRSITDFAALAAALQPGQVSEVISGGASGADALAERWARLHGKKLTVIKPDYSKYGKVATMVRNSEIVKRADTLLALWDGESKGTLATITMAKKAGKKVRVIIVR